MRQSWYKKCMPKVGQITSHLKEISDEIRKIDGVLDIYVWGSYAKNLSKENFRVADLDVIAKTSFYSEDLVSIDENILKNNSTSDQLEEQGYDPIAIKFSKEFVNIKTCNMDHWVLSKDKVLLHWGPIAVQQEDSEEINKEAEGYAAKETGFTRSKVNRASEGVRKNWYTSYSHFKDNYFSKMPSGWYQSDETDIPSMLKNSIRL